ncbi:MAG: esterase family protein [Bacteroidales bacterium]|nr:esterase family protein [Bacteroidales bacterium]
MARKKKKTALISIIVLVLLACAFWWLTHPHMNKTPEVSTGTLTRYPAFQSQFVSPRTVSVWVPDGYSEDTAYSVVYMHDGQMLFDPEATWNGRAWNAEEILGRLIGNGSVLPAIIVGIDNTEYRLNEYFPDKAAAFLPPDASRKSLAKHKGDAYLKFLVEELKPFIDTHYNTLPDPAHTCIVGSSMGGLISLYAICEYPSVFGGAGCLSSHVSFAHLALGKANEAWADSFRTYLSEAIPAPEGHRIWMDHGTQGFDAAYGPYQERIDALFRDRGWDEDRYISRVYEGHDHNEDCWSERLPAILSFLLQSVD